MADAGLRLSVEGEKEFKAALREIDAQLKINKSEIKLLTEEYKLNDTGIDSLVTKQKVLSDTINLQGAKVETLDELYKKSADTYGETDARVLKLKNSMVEAATALAKTSAEYESNNKALEEQQAVLADSQKAFELTGYDTNALGEALSELDASLKANAAELKAVATQYDNGSKKSKDFAAKEAELKKQNEILNNSIATQEKKIELLNAKMKIAADRYGEQSKDVSEYREQIADATEELQNMTEQVKKNAESLEDSGDSGDKLRDVLGKISDYTGVKIPDGITDMIGGFDTASVAAGGILTVVVGVAKKIGEVYGEMLKWADELTTKASEMDINTESYQALEYAASKLGVSMDTIQDAIKEINNRAGETDKVIKDQIGSLDQFSKATDDQKKAVYEAMEQWDELGVSIYDTTTGELRPAKDILYDLIDAFGNITNSTERSYKMNDMFGESYRKLNPIINAGTEILKKYEDEAYNVGYVMDEELVEKSDRAANAIEAFGMRTKAAIRNLFVGAGNKEWWEKGFIGGQLSSIGDLFDFIKTMFGIGGNAYGTYNFPGGLTWVGERGPELVELPTGSKVYPNGTLPNTLGGGTTVYNITIDANSVREFNDIVRIAQSERQSIRMGYVGG